MSDEKKFTVDDKITVLLAGDDAKANVVEYKEFLDKLETTYRANIIKPYEKFNVALVKDRDAGWGLLLTGTREETKEETANRQAAEQAKLKQLQALELKEYLRLHKKYGKRQEQES